ncbi:MAG: SUMF1/EgtB/PvdO family nonheme iron enzyme, partial [bacterium]|nr:SUMF1/EgtB/PvdO family nonheme iron enzyme [bacterium]
MYEHLAELREIIGAGAADDGSIRAAEAWLAEQKRLAQQSADRRQRVEVLREELATALEGGDEAKAERAAAALERELGEAGPADRDLSDARAWLDERSRAKEARPRPEQKRQQPERRPGPAPRLRPAPKRRAAVLLALLAIAMVVIAVVLWAILVRGPWGDAPGAPATAIPATPTPPPQRVAGAEWVAPGIGMRFRFIPAGTFEMGSSTDEADRYGNEQQHKVKLSRGYWIGETEVTQGQWKVLVGTNPSHFSLCGEDCPVEMVSWLEAVRYA